MEEECQEPVDDISLNTINTNTISLCVYISSSLLQFPFYGNSLSGCLFEESDLYHPYVTESHSFDYGPKSCHFLYHISYLYRTLSQQSHYIYSKSLKERQIASSLTRIQYSNEIRHQPHFFIEFDILHQSTLLNYSVHTLSLFLFFAGYLCCSETCFQYSEHYDSPSFIVFRVQRTSKRIISVKIQ